MQGHMSMAASHPKLAGGKPAWIQNLGLCPYHNTACRLIALAGFINAGRWVRASPELLIEGFYCRKSLMAPFWGAQVVGVTSDGTTGAPIL